MAARTESNEPRREPMACAGPECPNTFVPQRSTAKYCSATCRQRAGRAKKAASESAEAEPGGDTSHETHPLVLAVRRELDRAAVAESFHGQLALQLASKLASPDESGVSALSKELRAVVAAALGGVSPVDPSPEASSEDDEVKRAREARERKAREAAAR